MRETTELQEREPYRQLAASIPLPLFVIGAEDEIVFANPASEQCFGMVAAIPCGSAGALLRQAQGESKEKSSILPKGEVGSVSLNPALADVVAQVRRRGAPIEACDVVIETRPGRRRMADVSAAPYGGMPGAVVVIVHEREFAERMSRQEGFRERLNSLNGMAAMLAHEIKNPLAGIRGAAQLIGESLPEQDRALAKLICAESDRIGALVDSMEAFGDGRPHEFSPVNIHEVLDRARAIARVGFARHATFRDAFDPSLPFVPGDRDGLIQMFVNLLRNASDALPESGGEILLATAFRAGIFVGKEGTRRAVPLEVTVRDNGSGIVPDLLPHVFDPFVTTKQRGAGLGLALVAKIAGEHGGIVECDSVPGRTEFRVLLPLTRDGKEKA